MISFRGELSEFEDAISAFQLVTVDGMAPFLFTEDTDVVGLVAAIVPATTSSRTSRSSRTSGTGSDTTTTSRSSRSTRSSSSSTTTTDDGGYREAVRAHRQEFQLTLIGFAQSLGILTDSASAQSDTDTALLDIDAIAEEWALYPDRAAELVAPASESTLAGLYETWVDEISFLAETWQSARIGNASAEDILTQFGIVLDADDALGVELGESAGIQRHLAGMRLSRLAVA